MPVGMEGLASKLFSQGFQQPIGQGVWGVHPTTSPQKTGLSQDARGVWDAATSQRLPASLFMDDTTLVAQSRQDLELMAGAYVRYCFKFHMRLNASKSKLQVCG